MKRVVIVGAGFGGLEAARKLGNRGVQVTVIDRKNHHTFQPLLYQVALAALSPGEIAAPIRRILRKDQNIEVLLGEVSGFDLAVRRVFAHTFTTEYDYLIVAAGARHSYFGHPEWSKLAPGLKTLEDAVEIRRRVLLAYELAEREAWTRGVSPPLTFAIIGGGPTGVELAGTLAEVAHAALPSDFRHIDPTRTRILLFEGGPRVLPAYPEDLSRRAESQLAHLGVEVHTNTLVSGVEPGGVRLGEALLPTAVTLWAAGVEASPLGKLLEAPTDKAGRVLVSPDLSVPGHPEVFVTGDLAEVRQANGDLVPGLAPAAIQEGRAAAENILRDLQGQRRKNFIYWDKGTLATIGRNAAVGQIGRLHLSGFIAWMAWLFIHILFLVGFRNRIAVLFDWAFSYVSYERANRLITGTSEMPGTHENELPSFNREGEKGPGTPTTFAAD
jgi:NADH dehydrogenase